MNELEIILDDCLRRMSAQGYSIEQCLALYPRHADELRPLLERALSLLNGRAIVPTSRYKSSARAKLMLQAEAHAPSALRLTLGAWRATAVAVVIVMVMLLTTTAFAQAALPGQTLYTWKRASESVWRVLSPDRVTVDLELADRRATEWTNVVHDPRRGGQAMEQYHEALNVLEAEMNAQNGPVISQALLAHQKKLSQAGIKDKKLDDLVHGRGPKNK